MKKIIFILTVCCCAGVLFAQNTESQGCTVFGCGVLDGAVDDIGSGIKKIGQKTKEAGEKAILKLNQAAAERRNIQISPTGRPFIRFNNKKFYAVDTFSKGTTIRNEFVFNSKQKTEKLILRQYLKTDQPKPEEIELTKGYPKNPKESYHNLLFHHDNINPQDTVEATVSGPNDNSFQDYVITRTIEPDENTIREYIYVFRINNPEQHPLITQNIQNNAFIAIKKLAPVELISGDFYYESIKEEQEEIAE